MLLLAGRRESGNGESPMPEGMQKITPEWQTEQFPSVDSAVARVKGKHHDGDVLSGRYILPSNQVVPRALSSCVEERAFLVFSKEAGIPHHHSFTRY